MEAATDQLEGLFVQVGRQTADDLRGCGQSALAARFEAALVGCTSDDAAECAKGLEEACAVVAAGWEKATGGGWDLPCWREAYVLSQAAVSLAEGRAALGAAEPAARKGGASRAMLAIDMAFILGGPPEMLQPFLDFIDPIARPETGGVSTPPEEEGGGGMIPGALPEGGGAAVPVIGEGTAIERIESPDPKHFRNNYFKADRPVVVEGSIAGWPALERWRSMAYWEEEHGYRTVPLETGSHSGGDFKESCITVGEFVASHLRPSNRGDPGFQVGYVAQHALVDQLPRLAGDFEVPPYCGIGGEADVVNCWVGTSGTVTPLHFDGYDNLFAQVAGYKYVRLYAKSETKYLYRDSGEGGAGKGGGYGGRSAQRNISLIECENVDLEKFPLVERATYTETILGPGDVLYIPCGCWHYVRSLTTSISINFWF